MLRIGLPDDRAWGLKRKQFYEADVEDDHRIGKELNSIIPLYDSKTKFV